MFFYFAVSSTEDGDDADGLLACGGRLYEDMNSLLTGGHSLLWQWDGRGGGGEA